MSKYYQIRSVAEQEAAWDRQQERIRKANVIYARKRRAAKKKAKSSAA